MRAAHRAANSQWPALRGEYAAIRGRSVAVLIAAADIIDDVICSDELPSNSIGVPGPD